MKRVVTAKRLEWRRLAELEEESTEPTGFGRYRCMLFSCLIDAVGIRLHQLSRYLLGRNGSCRRELQRDESFVHPNTRTAEMPNDSLTDNLTGQDST